MRFKNIFAKQTLSRISWSIAVFALGAVATIFFVHIRRFEFDPKVNVQGLLTILMTFVIGFHLQHAMTGRASDDRIEKQMIIDGAKLVSSQLVKISGICRASVLGEISIEGQRVVLAEFKDLNRRLAELEELILLTPIVLDVSKFRAIKTGCFKLKKLTTGGLFPSAALTLSENIEVQQATRGLSAKLVAFIFYVNRL